MLASSYAAQLSVELFPSLLLPEEINNQEIMKLKCEIGIREITEYKYENQKRLALAILKSRGEKRMKNGVRHIARPCYCKERCFVIF